TTCPECTRQVSSLAPVCPGCGYPITNGKPPEVPQLVRSVQAPAPTYPPAPPYPPPAPHQPYYVPPAVQPYYPPPAPPMAHPLPYSVAQVPNGWGTAGLIFGILPTPLFGFVFSLVGLITNDPRRHSNTGSAAVGFVLSIVWFIIAMAVYSR